MAKAICSVQPPCSSMCSQMYVPSSAAFHDMVSDALLHVHSNATPGAIAVLQVLGAVHFMTDIAWQVIHSIPRCSPGLSQTNNCAVQSMQVIQSISLIISMVEPAMQVPENT